MKTIKKTGLIAVCCTVALLLLLPVVALADAGQRGSARSGACGGTIVTSLRSNLQGKLTNFVDADNDGVCDYFGLGRKANSLFIDQNGDGICDTCNADQGLGFVDANGDGLCDYYAAGQGSGCGMGQDQGQSQGQGQGLGLGYTDENNDGICDNYGTGQHNGGHGRGRGLHR